MEGWVDLGALITPWPEIEPTPAWSKVRCPNRCATKTEEYSKPTIYNVNLRVDGSCRSFSPEIEINQERHDDDDENHNSKNHTNDQRHIWPCNVMRSLIETDSLMRTCKLLSQSDSHGVS